MLAESLTEKQFKNAPDQPHPGAFPLEDRKINERSPGDEFGCGYLVYCYTRARLFGMLFAVKISASAKIEKKKKKELHSLSLQKKKKHYPRRYCRVKKKKAFVQVIDFQINYRS